MTGPYFKTYKDGSHIRLSNHAPWTEHYYKREFYNVIVKQVPPLNGCVLWSCLDEYPIFTEAAEYFNNRFVLYFKDRESYIIEEAVKHKIYTPKIKLVLKDEDFYQNSNAAKFLEETQIKRYCITIEREDFYFPEREAQALAMLKRIFPQLRERIFDLTHCF